MRKVVFINRYFYPDHSATSQMLSDLAFGLSAAGVQTTVLTSRQAYDNPQAELSPDEYVHGVHVIRIWTSRFGRSNLSGRAIDYLTFYISTAWQLLRIISKGTIVVAKTDPPMISVVAAIVVKIRGAFLVNWLQDLFPEVAVALKVKGASTLSPLLTVLRNYSLNSAKLNVVLGDRMAMQLQSYGIPTKKIRIIHNWADGTHIHPLPRIANPLRAKWHLQDKFVVGYSGNMGRAHDFRTLIDAAKLLTDRSDIVFLFIGSGAQSKWLKEQAKLHHINSFQFQPYQPRDMLTQSLGLPDIHLVSLQASLEGLIVPSKFYGIAAAGRPVLNIGDKDGEIARILIQHQCGYTIESRDTDGLVKHILNLSSNHKVLSTLGNNARNALLSHFDKNITIKCWIEALAFRDLNI